MDDASTEELLHRARYGDRAALNALCARYWPRLRARAQGDRDASELVQDAMQYLAQHLGTFAGTTEAAFTAWLQRILAHKGVDRFRRETAQKRGAGKVVSLDMRSHADRAVVDELAGDSSSPSRQARRNEDAARLARALAMLPERQREAVRLKHLEGWSLAAIAEHLGCTAPAVGTLITRGMAALRKHFPPEP
jgi:RNA polymerase sigma-70 factor (ECF subfamily)